MAPLPASQLAELTIRIQSLLSPTPYACSSLEQLTGGTTSFVYLGALSEPIASDDEAEHQVVVKYAAPFASCHTDFAVDVSRAKYEALLLGALPNLTPSPNDSAEIPITTPKLYWYNEAENLQVLQYIPSTTSLSTALGNLSANQAYVFGRALGHWLHNFHAGVSFLSTTHHVPDTIAENTEAVRLKYKLTWKQGSDVLAMLSSARHLDLSAEERLAWDAARARAINDMKTKHVDTSGTTRGIVHGDFWTGNVLIPNSSSPLPHATLHIIDFEFAHVSSRATDLGQLIGDLVERSAIDLSLRPVAAEMIRGFAGGYGEVLSELRWKVAVYVGLHVMNWWSRGPPGRIDQDEQIRKRGVQLARQGLEWVRAGWEKDGIVFADTLLQSVFERVEE